MIVQRLKRFTDGYDTALWILVENENKHGRKCFRPCFSCWLCHRGAGVVDASLTGSAFQGLEKRLKVN